MKGAPSADLSASPSSLLRSRSSGRSPAARRRPWPRPRSRGRSAPSARRRATVTGTVNPNGQATTWYVEYGTSTSYGSRTASQNAGSGTANAAVVGLPHRAHARHDLPLPRRRDQRDRHEPRRRRDLHDTVRARQSSPARDERDRVVGDAQRHRRSERPRDDVVLRVRDEHELRVEDGGTERRLRRQRGRRLGAGVGPRGRARLPLPPRRDERRRDEPRRRPAFLDGRAARRRHGRGGSISLTSARLNGTLTPNGHRDQLVFRVRDVDRATGRGRRPGTRARARAPSGGLGGAHTAEHGRPRTTIASSRRTPRGRASAPIASSAPRRPRPSRHGPAQSVGADDGDADRPGRPERARDGWYFEYGTSTRYGSRTPTRKRGSGCRPHRCRAALGPDAGHVYHFRLVAESDAGTSRGADVAVHDDGRDARDACAPGRLRARPHALRLVPVRRAGELVTLFAQTYGEGSPRSIATVLTAADGTWRYLAKPRIQTSYLASWNGSQSAASVVAVRPAVSLRRTATGRLSTRVVGARSFAGRVVQLQRRSATGRWVTIKRVQLNRRSAALFRAHAPARQVDAPHRDEREPGRLRLPGRLQPHDHRSPPLDSAAWPTVSTPAGPRSRA